MTRRSLRGSSLIELLLVLIVAGALLALAAPRYGAFRDGAAVRSATADITRTLSWARRTAMLRRALVTVAFDSVGGASVVRSGGEPLIRQALALSYGIRLSA